MSAARSRSASIVMLPSYSTLASVTVARWILRLQHRADHGSVLPSALRGAARGCRSGARPARPEAAGKRTASASSVGAGERAPARARASRDRAARRSRARRAAPSRSRGARARGARAALALAGRDRALGGARARARGTRRLRRASRRRGSALRLDSASPSASRTVGTPTISTSKPRSRDQAADHRELLEVLLAEHRDVGLRGEQQLRHDRRDAAEVARPRARRRAAARAPSTSTQVCAPGG